MSEPGPVFRRAKGSPYDPRAQRDYHRLTTVRSTSLKMHQNLPSEPLYLGRLTHYYAKANRALAKRIVSVPFECMSLVGERSGELGDVLRKLSISILQVPSGRVSYAVTVDAAVSSDRLVALLEDCYYETFSIALSDGRMIMLSDLVADVFREQLDTSTFHVEPDLHQLLFLSPELSELGIDKGRVELKEETLLGLVYRVYDPMREGFTSVQFPAELNRGWDAIAAVGSFVSVLCGHQDYVENAALLSASQVVGALSDLRETQEIVLDSLRMLNHDLDLQTRGIRRAALRDLSERLAVLEMHLSAHVEAAADIGLWIPSLRVEDYHRSVVRSVRLVERSELIGKSVARLTSIAAAKAQALDTLDSAVADHRRHSWALVAGLSSAVAIPVSFVLAFLSVSAPEVDPQASMFDLHKYLAVYVFAFGMVALVGLSVSAFWYIAHPLRRGHVLNAGGSSRRFGLKRATLVEGADERRP